MDSVCAAVVDKWSYLLPSSERAAIQNVDLQWLAERSSTVWTTGIGRWTGPFHLFFFNLTVDVNWYEHLRCIEREMRRACTK